MNTEDQIIKLYKDGYSIRKVASETKTSATQVRRILIKNGIESRKNKTDSTLEKIIFDRYKCGESSEKIASNLNINASTVCRIIKRLGGAIRPSTENKRIYKINPNWLDNIDTEEKAYFLGFMYADGCISKNGFKLELHQQDIEILTRFRDLIFCGDVKPDIVKNNKYAKLSCSSIELKNALLKHGCVENKTFKITFPNLIEDVIPHFVRGVYDGDGCISICVNRCRIILTGYDNFLLEMQKVISKILNIKSIFRLIKENVADLTISKKEDVYSFLDWMYKDSSIYLQRKHNKQYEAKCIINTNLQNNKSSNILSYNGKKLTSSYLNMITKEEKLEICSFLKRHFRASGFPYEKHIDSDLKEDYNKLQGIYNKDLQEVKSTNGIKISKHFCPQIFDVRSKHKPSMFEAFNNDEMLEKVLKNRLGITYKETFNITGNMIRQGLRNSHVAFGASIFKPSIAKFFYDNYTDSNSIVLDISAGFGQRMLGAGASKNVKKYIGIDPFRKNIESLRQMKDFFNINAELHCIGSESFVSEDIVDFCFSSPPFFDKEIYCDDVTQAYSNRSLVDFCNYYWRPTALNVKNALKPNGLFIINMDKAIFEQMLLYMDGFLHVDTLHFLNSRSHMTKNSYDHFFVLKKQ